MLGRTLILAYGVCSYAIFFGTYLYAFGFVGNILTPTSLDGPPIAPFWESLAINLGLLSLFALQHSGMARPAFKRWLTRFVPQPAERSTYVLLSSLALILLFWQWRPMGGILWNVEALGARTALQALFATGFLIVLVCTFLINHFDLFGLRQVWLQFVGVPYRPLAFKTPGPYKHVRHPLYVGWILAFWATPTMTVAHLVFALATTAYILLAIVWEERDLQDAHPEYASYRQSTGKLLPRALYRFAFRDARVLARSLRSSPKHTPERVRVTS